jgi:CBS domain-containing protein
MREDEELANMTLRHRPAENVTLSIPSDTLEAVRREAARRDMSPEALLKLYIGSGLRQDVARSFSDGLLDTPPEVLARHVSSE